MPNNCLIDRAKKRGGVLPSARTTPHGVVFRGPYTNLQKLQAATREVVPNTVPQIAAPTKSSSCMLLVKTTPLIAAIPDIATRRPRCEAFIRRSRGLCYSSLVLIATCLTSCQLPYAQLKATVLLQSFLISLHDRFR